VTHAFARRLAGGGQSGRAQSAEKALDRLNAEKVKKPFQARRRTFRFPPVENMGERVASVEHLTHGYNGRPLFEDTSLEVVKGDRIAIIGPNGAGKSTLLRLLMGTEKPQSGSVRLGEHSIVPNYYEQNQSEALDPSQTVIGTLRAAADSAREDEIKALLGKMMFKGGAFDKEVGVLSGGEKARLALAKFMLTKGTLLVLDEPTNHLDIPSKEMLEEAVVNFEGAVIAVSHDRYFLRKVSTRVITVENHQLVDYTGDYDYYLQARCRCCCPAPPARSLCRALDDVHNPRHVTASACKSFVLTGAPLLAAWAGPWLASEAGHM
jgi:ATPase subunit of ABC transporter with duplicated ATPase domains